MLKDSRSRRRLFFVSSSVGMVSILVLIARTARDPEARFPNAMMLVALVAFAVLVWLQWRNGRRNR